MTERGGPSGTERTYLDLQVRRIQQYLGRWDRLVGRRGASVMINEATDAERLNAQLGHEGRVSEEMPAVDGKVVIEVASGADPRALAERLLSDLATFVPAAELSAVWSTGSTYVDAYEARKHGGGNEVQLIPPLGGYPLTRPCDRCGLSPATQTDTRLGEQVRVCEDCSQRTSRTAREGKPEQTLLERFESIEAAADFGALAQCGIDEARNHLATIYIDGNRMGRFFSSLSSETPEVKQAISSGLSDATFESLVAASTELLELSGGTTLPVTLHVFGGDDVLVSVPASLGWAFVRTFLETFEERTTALVAQQAPTLREFAPTASAGLLFAQVKHPFSACVAAAEALLDDAKSAPTTAPAGVSAVSWADLTVSGTVPAPHQAPWSLAEIHGNAALVTELLALPPSTQATLRRLGDRRDAVVGASLTLLQRRGQLQLDALMSGSDWSPDAPRQLRQALAASRWWS